MKKFVFILTLFIVSSAFSNKSYRYDISENIGATYNGQFLLPYDTDIKNVIVIINESDTIYSDFSDESKEVFLNNRSFKYKKFREYLKISSLGVYKLLDIALIVKSETTSLEIIIKNFNKIREQYYYEKDHYNRVFEIVENRELLEDYKKRLIINDRSKPTFLIMTTNAILDTVKNLPEFVNMKNRMGYDAKVITEDQWGGGIGDVAANNIREWLKENYNSMNIKYVLFIGYPHPEKGQVPMKMTWPQFNETDYREAPTDLFYADLSGDWDIDKDNNYGEFEDDFLKPGGPDIYAELNVGRIPVYSKTKVEHIINKLIKYESESEESAKSWRFNVLMAMNNMNDESDPNFTPGIRLAEAINKNILKPKNISSFRIYDDNYADFISDEPANLTPCTYATVKNTWNSQDFGVVLWQAHGFAQHATDVMSIPYSKVLNDDRVPFVMSTSCHNGRPETDNLSMYLLQNGAINVVSASRVEYWAPGQSEYWKEWPTGQSFCYNYADYLIGDSLTSSEALNRLKANIEISMLELNSMWWMNWLVFNVYGDPSHGLYTWDGSLSLKKRPSLSNFEKVFINENSKMVEINLKEKVFDSDNNFNELEWNFGGHNKVEAELIDSILTIKAKEPLLIGDDLLHIKVFDPDGLSDSTLLNIEVENKTEIIKISELEYIKKIQLIKNPIESNEPVLILNKLNNLEKLNVKVFNCLGDLIENRELNQCLKGDVLKIELKKDIKGSHIILYECLFKNGERKRYGQILGIIK